MTQTILLSALPLAAMMFVGAITPGPNNLMLMLAGTRYGFLRTLPHMIGVTTGTVLVICLAYAGLGALMLGHPHVMNGMTAACSLYLMWMAVRLFNAGPPEFAELKPAARPVRFLEALLFQFVNPKVWTMAVAATSIAARFPFSAAGNLAIVATTTPLVSLPSIAVWAAFGKIMRRSLSDPRTRRIFDSGMAALVFATAVWIAWPLLPRAG